MCLYSGKDKDGYHIMAYDKDSPEWSLNGEHNLMTELLANYSD